jgi:hypothetical protein
MNCFLKDGTIEDFVKATFDPIASLTTLKVSQITISANSRGDDGGYRDVGRVLENNADLIRMTTTSTTSVSTVDTLDPRAPPT